MKKVLTLFTLIFIAGLSYGQYRQTDSVYFYNEETHSGRYYSPPEYYVLKDAQDKRKAQRGNHGDSVYYQGKYRSPEEYKRLKAEYDSKNYESWFMPGLGYTYYQPKASDSVGTFSGLAVEYMIYTKVAQDNDPGPSHVRFYGKLNILNSSKTDMGSMFMYTLGLDLSLEKNPNRCFLIPYFGLEFGGISQKQFKSTIQFSPTFGIHIFSKKNLTINAYGGYLYPISNFETLQGWFGQAGINFALW